jgi:histidinol-phosphate aminotransferase
MQHYPALTDQAARLVNERTRLAAALAAMPRVQHFPSDANFVLIRVPDAANVFKQLLSRRILVKNTSTAHPLLANTLRLTVGTPAENDQLIAALQDLLVP